MRKRLKTALTALLVIFASLLAWLGLRRPAPEPIYHGKRLHVWLQEYYNGRNSAARHALQHIGTNAIPTLLRLLQQKDFYAKSNLTHQLSADLSPMRFVSAATIADRARINLEIAVLDTLSKNPAAYQLNLEAALGFRILGADALPALPALIKIYERNISLDSRLATCEAIRSIGVPAGQAVPCLLRGATDPNVLVRLDAIVALWHIHPEPPLVLPALIRSLSDTNFAVREIAAWALSGYGTNAQSALPALRPLLNDTNEEVAKAVTNALAAIDPESAAKD